MQGAEETTVYREVDPEAAPSQVEVDPEAPHSQAEVDVEAAPRPTVVDEIRATIRQLKRLQRLQGIKGEGFTDAVLRGLGVEARQVVHSGTC